MEHILQSNGHNDLQQTDTSVFDEFHSNLATLSAVYDKLENTWPVETTSLLRRGRQVQRGMASWTKHDLEEIVRWRKIQSLMPKIDTNIELALAQAFTLQDEESKVEVLCRIPGIGPVLASVLLTLTSPEKYAPLDNHTWSALSRLGFDIRKRPFSGGGYTVHELLRYLRIVRSLARSTNMLPWDVAKALHALDRVNTKMRWKTEFDLIKLASNHLTPNTKSQNSAA